MGHQGWFSDLRSGPRDGTEGPTGEALRQAVATEGSFLSQAKAGANSEAYTECPLAPSPSTVQNYHPANPISGYQDREAVQPDSPDEGSREESEED